MINRTDVRAHIHRGAAALGLVVFLAGIAGCRSKPARRYEVRQTELGMLASNAPRPQANTYVISQKDKTVGRFPASLAVVRVTGTQPEGPAGTDSGGLRLDLLPEIKAVPWTELFDNFPPVTSVKVMGRPAVTFENVTVTELVEAGRRQHASLILVYGRNDLPGGLVKLVGAIYDVATGELLATMDAQVEPVPGLPTPPDRIEQDRRHEDPECLTIDRFQDLVLHCIVELAGVDIPATTTQPNPWDRPGIQPMLSPWTGPRYVW